MARISEIQVAVPSFCCEREDIVAEAKLWLSQTSKESALFERFLGSSRIRRRHFVLPPAEIRALGGQAARCKIFAKEGTALAAEAIGKVLAAAELTPRDIDTLIFTSCTAPLIPSPDAYLVNVMEFSKHVRRLPIYQHGCAGGAAGLALARMFADHGERVLVCSSELCSLGFHGSDLSGGNLVGSAIFADGAACALVEPGPGSLSYVDCMSTLIPETEGLMGYDIHDDGAHLRLDKELPSAVATCVAELVPSFLAKNGLAPSDVSWWLHHPGGAKILEIFDNMFALREEQSRFAWDVLENFGNMSSASVMFVMNEYLESGCGRAGDYVIMLGIGPGITLQLLLFQQNAQ